MRIIGRLARLEYRLAVVRPARRGYTHKEEQRPSQTIETQSDFPPLPRFAGARVTRHPSLSAPARTARTAVIFPLSGNAAAIWPHPSRQTISASIWLHAVSVGEVLAAVPLLEELETADARDPCLRQHHDAGGPRNGGEAPQWDRRRRLLRALRFCLGRAPRAPATASRGRGRSRDRNLAELISRSEADGRRTDARQRTYLRPCPAPLPPFRDTVRGSPRPVRPDPRRSRRK